MEFKQYRRTQIVEMRPVTPEEIELGRLIMTRTSTLQPISGSEVDLQNGSPKEGDMIARNPDNHADQWPVAKAYFDKNFEPMEAYMPRSCPPTCPHLSLTEEEQNAKFIVENPTHVCHRFERHLYYGPFHPELIRLEECYFSNKE